MTDDAPIDPALQSLLAAARKVAQPAYAPYSNFRVGAALRFSNGAVVTGTNVENVSYGLTICAERAAMVRAIAEHGPQIRVEAVSVSNLNDAPGPPCGACRQFLAEFISDGGVRVVFPAASGVVAVAFAELLPHAFEANLK